ncbi:MAG TPA: type II toxin-antitoxin system HicB family antitoxin [Nitrospirota bacterium]|nr:type II toxin-antitoxin system HicB family antitoxin [Nitrospirota bacterium]
MKYKVVLEKAEEGGYTAYVPALRGCISEGDTEQEALENIKIAIKEYLEAIEDANKGKKIIEVEVAA